MRVRVELAWLQDYLELAATRNFSAAAASRNISQPAFSRRIRALEAWLGADLVDRSTSPVQLTAVGATFAPRAQEILGELFRLRAECRQTAQFDNFKLSFAALHTIEMFFFPDWVAGLQADLGPIESHMHGGDFLECVEALSQGRCDFALVYDHPDGPPVLKAGPFRSVGVGRDRLVPVSGCNASGGVCHDLFRADRRAVPFLAYSWKDGYVGKLVSLIQGRQKRALRLQTVYQSSLTEGIKRMAIAGMGVAWLPLSCARTAIAEGRLVQIGDENTAIDIELRMFRRIGPASPAAEALWTHLSGLAPDARIA